MFFASVKEAELPRTPDDGPSSLARGIAWASQVSSLTFELAGPMFAGYWLDQRWGTSPGLLLLGAVLGLFLFGWGIVRLSREISKKP